MSSKRVISLIVVALFTTAAKSGPISEDYDVIIVGLGAAGATAASTLARAGKRVLALEAEDRIGGRVKTQAFGDGVVEVGAEWMHGTSPNPIYDAAVEHNVTTKEQDLEPILRQSDGNEVSESVKEVFDKGLEISFDAEVEKSQPLGEYVTNELKEYMRENQPDLLKDNELVSSILEYLNLSVDSYEGSSSWNDVNAVSSYKGIGGHQHVSWHTHGYKTYFDIVLNKYKDGKGLPTLEIKLNTEVTQIQWPKEPQQKVIVKCKDGATYTADTAIVTVSLGVLKERFTTLFSPPLPVEKQTAIEKIAMGVIGKMILAFPEAWWPNKKNITYDFIWTPEDLKKVSPDEMWTTKIIGASTPMGSSNTITLWSGGEIAKLVETLPEDLLKRKAIDLLRKFMGNNTKIPEPIGFIRTQWFTNPFTRGTYTYDSMQAASLPGARSALASPLKDSAGRPRLLFAGEATHETRFSTVHGAAETGLREAKVLLPSS